MLTQNNYMRLKYETWLENPADVSDAGSRREKEETVKAGEPASILVDRNLSASRRPRTVTYAYERWRKDTVLIVGVERNAALTRIVVEARSSAVAWGL